MLRGILIEDGIRVVDVNKYFAARRVGGELREQSIGSGKRKVADFARGPVGAPGAHQFIVGPERAVDQSYVRGNSQFLQFGVLTGKRSRNKELFAILFEQKPERAILRRSGAGALFSDAV